MLVKKVVVAPDSFKGRRDHVLERHGAVERRPVLVPHLLRHPVSSDVNRYLRDAGAAARILTRHPTGLLDA
jgi:hypothetical protein